MSIHGIQLRLPFSINGKTKQEIHFEESMAANFIQLVKRIDFDSDEKLLNFSMIMWPFIFIQAKPNQHVMIDDVGISKLKEKIINSPRTAQIGHVLRNPELEQLKQLDIAKQVIKFEHRIKLDEEEDVTAGEDEFVLKEVKGLINPDLLSGFSPLISKNSEFKMSDMPSLESLYSFDDALSFTTEFVKIMDLAHGNMIRWTNIKTLFNEPLKKWRTEITVQIKDLNTRYKNAVQRAKGLDDSTIVNRLDTAKDSQDQWVIREKKNLIDKIGGLFYQMDLIFEDLRRENKFFLDTDTLRTNKIDFVVKKSYQHIAHLRSSLEESDSILKEISIKMNDIRAKVENIEESAKDKIQTLNVELLDKKSEQEDKIEQIQLEHERDIDELEVLLSNINKNYEEIEELIDSKVQGCAFDEQNLIKWQVHDSISKIPNPTVRYFVPFGMAVIEDEDEDERIEIVFPSIYEDNLKRIPLHKSFNKFEKEISKILDKNMKIRSNFEFAGEKINIKNSEKYRKAIKDGLDWLVRDLLLEASEKQQYLDILDSF
jgi:hypothetical protein